MKLPINIYRNVLFPLLITLFFWSCTLVDNDLRDLPDNPAYREIVHEEGESYTADYQYQPWTILVDERYESYIASIDYVNSVLYLHDYIPEDMLPKAGNALAAKPSDKLEWGLSYKVVEVRRLGGNYAVYMQKAELLDIFTYIEYNLDEELVLNDNTLEKIDNNSTSYVLTRGGDDPNKPIPYNNPNDEYWYKKEKPGTWSIDLIKEIKAIYDAKGLKKSFDDFDNLGSAAKTLRNIQGLVESITTEKDPDFGVYEIKFPRDQNWTQEDIESAYRIATNSINDISSQTTEEQHISEARTERQRRENARNAKLKDAFEWEVDALLKCVISVTPTLKIKNYVYENKDDKNGGKTDVSLEICGDFNIDILVGGRVTINIDILHLVELITKKPRPQIAKARPGPAGVPVWIHFKPMLNLITSLEGRIGYNAHKYFSIGCGYRKNIKDKADGLYKINNTKPLEWKEDNNWTQTGGGYSRISFDAMIKFVPHTVLGIGIPGVDFLDAVTAGTLPEDQPILKSIQGGINITLEYDPSIAVEFKAERTEELHGQTRLHFGVPVSWKDLLFVFRPWPGWEIPIKFGDFLSNWIKGDHEFFSYDWYWHPFFTVGASCTNPYSKDSPEFNIEMVLDDLGINYDENNPAIPILYVFRADDGIDNTIFTKAFPAIKKKDELRHYTQTLSDEILMKSVFQRGEIYIARLELVDKHGKSLCYSDFPFTSTTPTAYIRDDEDKSDKLIYWEAIYDHEKDFKWTPTWYKDKGETEETIKKAKEFVFKFITKVNMQNYEKIEKLGFYVGDKNKRYLCDGKPITSFANCIWEIKSKTPTVKLAIRPFAGFTDSQSQKVENIWPKAYVVEYDYTKNPRDPNWGGTGVAYKIVDKTISGWPRKISFGKERKDSRITDWDISVGAKEKSEECRGLYLGEENGVPTYMFTINPEDM